ncbi:hypothetical protein K461DRAFT_268587 [Myriangium duriaei CBS 260.36]|uniref:Zn(2)-C6 fungal-type domain-containing protein n=1 Tax=Myriangium duriaei CBS 260.36 TaxID=1168546 RepID=A0A9P4MMF2_9PEZI|nr:hypothetical protein K461DRAFT_268587 [Myriangium duriaei CBS 260.36]
MVYTGPSDGCHLCRKRRIKCDGGRPGCQRCAIYKAKCPGYRTDVDFKFVNDNDAAETKALATRRKSGVSKAQIAKAQRNSAAKSNSSSSSPPSPFTRKSSVVSTNGTAHPASPSSTSRTDSIAESDATRSESTWALQTLQRPASDSFISAPPTPAWEDWSISSFLHDWTLPESTTGFGIGFQEFLPDLYSKSSPDVDLSLAVRAASYASFANQHSSPQMMAKARTSYGKALTALNLSLRRPLDAVKDTTIATIILLQIFEHITCDDSLSMGNHDSGLRMLLNMRGDSQLDTSQGRGIARIIFGYLFSRDVTDTRNTSDVMKRGAHRLGYPPEHPARQRRPGSNGMPEILRQLNLLFSRDPTDPAVRAEAIQLMQSLAHFDQVYDHWTETVSQDWQARKVRVTFDHLNTKATTVPRSGIVHMYGCQLLACYNTIWRMQYVTLHKKLIRMANYLGITDWSIPPSADSPEGYHLSVLHSLGAVHRLNHEILSSAACAVGEVTQSGGVAHMTAGRAVGAYYLLWPLMHITHDELATKEQKEDAKRALAFIGNVLGIKRAVRTPNRPLAQGSSPRGEWDNVKSSPKSESSSSPSLVLPERSPPKGIKAS